MANQWFKFYGGEYLSDPKIERLNPIERSCWITILSMASMGDDGVIEFLTVESLLNRSGIQFDPYHPEDWEKALGVLIKFQNLKMIDCDKDGRISVLNWEKRQEHNLTVAERVAKSRAKRKDVTINVTNVTSEENRIEENRVDKDIPIWLNKKAWEAWIQYKKERKQKMTPSMIKFQLKVLEKNQKDHAEIIKNSITNGWTGLFPLKDKFTRDTKYNRVVQSHREEDEDKQTKEDNNRLNILKKQAGELGSKMKI